MNSKTKTGFTLIELLVVIAIIALLLAILLPGLGKAKEASRRTVCGAHMHDLGVLIRVYAQERDDLLPAMHVTVGGVANNNQVINHWARWWRVYDKNTSQHYYWNMGLLWSCGLMEDDNGKIFYCPSAKNYFPYKDYSSEGFPTDYQPGATSDTGVRVPYSFNPECESTTNRQRKYKKITRMRSNSVLLLDLMTNEGVTHEKGWNILRGDGSVAFSMEQDAQRVLEESTDFESKDYTALDEVIELLK